MRCQQRPRPGHQLGFRERCPCGCVFALIREATDSPGFSSDPSSLFTQQSVMADYCWSGTEWPRLLALRNPSYSSMIKKENLAGDGSVTITRALDFTWCESSPAEWLTDGMTIQVPGEPHMGEEVQTCGDQIFSDQILVANSTRG